MAEPVVTSRLGAPACACPFLFFWPAFCCRAGDAALPPVAYNKVVHAILDHVMVLTLPHQIEVALAEHARRQGIAPETLAVDVLRRHLLSVAPPAPADEWEMRLFNAAIDCGVSVPDVALSSDGLYD